MGYPAKTSKDAPSAKELRILVGKARGESHQHIAGDLHVTRPTVSTHLSNMYRRYRAVNAAHLVAIGFRRGWLSVGGES